MSTTVVTRFISWLDDVQEVSVDNLLIGFGYLLFSNDGVPIRRKNAELITMRKRYLDKGEEFPLDRLALIALNRIVHRPLRFTKTTDQLGRVLAVAYDYPQFQKDPVIPISLVQLGPTFDKRLKRLTRHIDNYGSGAFTNQQGWGRKARRLADQINASLQGITTLSERELLFLSYHLELTIAQPWRTK